MRLTRRTAWTAFAALVILAATLIGVLNLGVTKQYILRKALALSGVPAQARTLDYTLRQGEFRLTGVRIPLSKKPGATSKIEIADLLIDLDLRSLVSRKVRFDRIEASGVNLDLDASELAPSKGGSVKVPEFDSLRIADFAVHFRTAPGGLQIVLPQNSVEIDRSAVRLALQRPGEVRFGDATEAVKALDLTGTWQSQDLNITAAAVDLAGGRVEATGRLGDLTGQLRMNLATRFDLRTSPIALFLPKNLLRAGTFTGEARLTNANGFEAAGSLAGKRVALEAYPPVDAASDFSWDATAERLTLDKAHVDTPFGTATGTASLAVGDANAESTIIAQASGWNVAKVARSFRVDAPIASTASGTLRWTWTGTDLLRGRATSNITLTPLRIDSAEQVPVGARLTATVAGGRFSVNASDGQSPYTTFRGSLSCRVNGTACDGTLRGDAPLPKESPLQGTLGWSAVVEGSLADPSAVATIAASDLTAGLYQGISLTGEASYSEKLLQVQSAVLTWQGQRLSATGEVSLANDPPTLSARIEGDGLLVKELVDPWEPGLNVNGTAGIVATLSGPLEKPEVVADISGAGLEYLGEAVGSLAARLRYAGTEVTVDSLKVTQPDGELTASGNVSLETRAIEAELQSKTLRVPLFELANGETAHALIDLTAEASGTLDDPNVSALGELRGVRIGSYRGGRITTALSIADRRATLDWRSPRIGGRGRVEFGFDGDQPFKITAVTKDSDIVPGLFEFADLPNATLKLSSRLSAEGTLRNWKSASGEAEVSSLDARVLDETIALSGPLRFTVREGLVSVDPVKLLAAGNTIEFSGSLPIENAVAGAGLEVRGDLSVPSLLRVAKVGDELKGTGGIAIAGRLEGTLIEPVPNIAVTASGVTFTSPELREPLKIAAARVRIDRGGAQLEAFQGTVGEAKLSATGEIPAPGWKLASVKMAAEGVTAPMFTRAPEFLAGRVDAIAEADIDLQNLENSRGTIRLPRFDLGAGDAAMSQSEESRLRVERGRLYVDKMDLKGPKTNLHVEGSAQFTGERQFDLRAQGRAEASGLFVAAGTFSASGLVDFDATLTGDWTTPKLRAEAEVTDGNLRSSSPRLIAENVRFSALLDDDRLALRSLTGRLNGGTVEGSGVLPLKGATKPEEGIRLSLKDVFFDEPLKLQTLNDANLRLSFDGNQYLISGRINVQEGGLRAPLDWSKLASLGGGKTTVTVVGEKDNAFDRLLRFDVELITDERLVINNNLARFTAAANLRLVGTLEKPALLGRIEVDEGGYLNVIARRFTLERATIDFADQNRIEPLLDLRASTSVGNYSLDLAINGGFDDLEVNWTSSPSLSEENIYSLLLTGSPNQGQDGESAARSQRQFLSLVGVGLVGSVTDRLQQRFGFSQFRVEPGAVAGETNASARLTIGKTIGDKLEVISSTSLVNSSDQIWIAEYRPRRRLLARFVRQSDETYRSEGRYVFQFGGGPGTGDVKRPKSERLKIGKIVLTGELRFPEEELRKTMKIKTGQTYDAYRARQAVERLQDFYGKREYLEASIRAERDPRNGILDLTYRIDAGPKVEFTYEGFEATKKLRGQVRESWREGVVDQQRLDETKTMVERYLWKRGFIGASVAQRQETTPERDRILFDATAGIRYDKVSVVFDGLVDFYPDELMKPLKAKNLHLAPQREPEKVAAALVNEMRAQGYLNGSVGTSKLELSRGGKVATFRIPIVEGPSFTVGLLEFVNNRRLTAAELARDLPVIANDMYWPRDIDAARQKILEKYWAIGHRDADVTASLRIDEDEGLVDVVYTIDEKRRSVVAGVQVEGNVVAREGYIRQLLNIKPGSVDNYGNLTAARRRLIDSRAFDQVQVLEQSVAGQPATAQPAAALPANPDKPVDILVRVREPKPFEWTAGVYYDSLRGPGIVSDLSNRNALGQGRVLGLRTLIDADRRENRIYFTQPFWGLRPISTEVSYFTNTTTVEDSFRYESRGVNTIQEVKIRNRFRYSYGLRYTTVDLFLIDSDEVFINATTGTIVTALLRDTRDEILDASRGSFISQGLDYAPGAIGGDVKYAKYFGQFFKYVPLTARRNVPFSAERRARVVFATGLRLGLSGTIGGTVLLPTERFFAGGGSTIRGYRQNELGASRLGGTASGGQAMVILNNEIRFPMYRWLDGAAFTDSGNLFERVAEFSFGDLRHSAGFGVRLRNPFVLVRFDYALKIGRRPGERIGAWYFSIGQAF